MAGKARPDPPLPCPECLANGQKRSWVLFRIGTRKTTCRTCNRFNQDVMRTTRVRFKEEYPEEYERIRLQVEKSAYREVLAAWVAEHADDDEMMDS